MGANYSQVKMSSSSGGEGRKRRRLAENEENAGSAGIDLGAKEENNEEEGDVFIRFEKARRVLKRAEKNMANIRAQLRLQGLHAPDSLLYLSDGEDSPILTSILLFLSVDDVGRCELTCKCLRNLALKQFWFFAVKNSVLPDNPHCQSPSAKDNDPRAVVIRYHLASTLAERIGRLGDTISRHVYTSERIREGYGYGECEDKRVSNHCRGCNFPDLDLGVCHSDTRGNYELYVRFSRTVDNALLAEGFFPFSRDSTTNIEIHLDELNTSNWSKMEQITNSVGEMLNDELLQSCMQELTATIIAVNVTCFEASLVAAQCNFSQVDNMGEEGFCWPRGRLAAKSHGDLETVRKLRGYGSYYSCDTTLSTLNLGMLFHSSSQYDPSNPEETRKWLWTLSCDYDLAQD